MAESILVSAIIFIMGMASACLLVLWANVQCSTAKSSFTTQLVLQIGFAVLLNYLLFELSPRVALYTALAAFLVSAALIMLYGALSRRNQHIQKAIKKDLSKKRRPMGWKTHALFGLFGVAFGVGVFSLAGNASSEIVSLALLVGAAAAFVDITQAGGVYPNRMKSIVFVFSVGVLLLVAFGDRPWQMLWWSILPAGASYFFVIQFGWLILSGHRYQLNMQAFTAEADILICCGAGVGFLLNWTFDFLAWPQTLLIAGIIFLMALGFALLSLDDLRGLSLLVFQEFNKEESEFSSTEKMPFKKHCNNISKTYGLTQRETEVLFLLAKGQRAGLIADNLSLSKYTIKTHIYHIYQKLEVNSQQELMALVDDCYKKT